MYTTRIKTRIITCFVRLFLVLSTLKDSLSFKENRQDSRVITGGGIIIMAIKEITIGQGLTKEETELSLQKIDEQLRKMSQIVLNNIKKQEQRRTL